ncbi:MAG TPA: ribokinase [Thermohalobaculum sp.]|nr:ribokinase [Thermohalobaculum sp.]
MTVFNLGSINVDHVHRVPRLPAPGETLADTGYAVGLGGKGANMSVAIARAGGRVRHLGAVGADGGWAVERLGAEGVDTGAVATVAEATGHAVIHVDPAGENQIVIHGGANRALTAAMIEAGLADARPGDWLLTQAETNLVVEAAELARARGLRIAHAAAPFDADLARAMLPLADLLVLNEGEAAALAARLGHSPRLAMLAVTLGARGARLEIEGRKSELPAFAVDAVDTTGAGDTFTGYALAGLDAGLPPEAAFRRGIAAAAIQVTRPGAAQAIPTAAELDRFLAADR